MPTKITMCKKRKKKYNKDTNKSSQKIGSIVKKSVIRVTSTSSSCTSYAQLSHIPVFDLHREKLKIKKTGELAFSATISLKVY